MSLFFGWRNKHTVSPRSARNRRCWESSSRSLKTCVRLTSLLRRAGSSMLAWTAVRPQSACRRRRPTRKQAGGHLLRPLVCRSRRPTDGTRPSRVGKAICFARAAHSDVTVIQKHPHGHLEVVPHQIPGSPSPITLTHESALRVILSERGPTCGSFVGSAHGNVQRTETGCRGQKRGSDHAREKKEDELHVAVEPGAPRAPTRPCAPGSFLYGLRTPRASRCAMRPSRARCRAYST